MEQQAINRRRAELAKGIKKLGQFKEREIIFAIQAIQSGKQPKNRAETLALQVFAKVQFLTNHN